MASPDRRWIPSVDAILRGLPASPLPRPLIVQLIRRELAELRGNASDAIASESAIRSSIVEKLNQLARARLQPVINATGVILHTNLGRAPLSAAAANAVAEAAAHYNTLEFDLDLGERGQRGHYLETALATLCGSPAATVVNNCAAALMLIINTLTAGAKKQVIISRGELVQIGGGFRVPDILQASGALLREVGTTNQTTLDDYRRAICDETALILRVHRSNFFMDGFVSSPGVNGLATIAREAGVPLIDDLGSGAVFDTAKVRSLDNTHLAHEPTPAASINAGVNALCFSGDKLFGGPQAGIIAGDETLIARFKRNPIFRALRCDKLTFAALQNTVESLLNDDSAELPLRRMLDMPLPDLKRRAECIVQSVGPHALEIVDSVARVGGGSLPQARLPSIALQICNAALRPQALLKRLREQSPPVIAMIDRDRVTLDLRTVFPEQDEKLVASLAAAINATQVS